MKLVINPIYQILNTHAFGFGVFSVLFAFFFFAGGLVVANGQTLGANDSHIVSLYVDGKETAAPTRAITVGEFVQKAQITINESDLVEPALNTTIDSDNFRIHVYHAKPVTIVDGADIKHVMTPHKTPQLIAEKAGFTVYPEDKYQFNTTSTFIKDNVLGVTLNIDRAVPVTISLYGSLAATYRTHVSTVGDLLKERGIVPEAGATVTPEPNTPLTQDLPIFISKYGKQVVTLDEVVRFETITHIDPNKPLGYKEIITIGKDGQKQVVYEIDLRDGKEIGRRVLQEVITSQSQKQEMTVGGKTEGFSGDFAAALAKLRSCEGAYTSNTGNGYYGAYQFNLGTWRSNAPAGYGEMLPSNTSPEIQDQAAANLYKSRGWQPWPSCSRSKGLLDIYR
ncbi:MAG: transglycosylase family protein [Candidatus Saccharibacteria bacterium]